MAKKHRQAGTPVLRALQAAGIKYRLYEYEHSSVMEHGYALDTADVLGLDPALIYKTLLIEDEKENPAVAVVPATQKLSLKLMAKALGVKSVKMPAPAKAERITGYVTGGISPIGQKRALRTVIDSDAEKLPQMLVSGGKRSLSVGISPADLIRLTGAKVAPITANKDG